MNKILLLVAFTLTACSAGESRQAVDNTPGTQTTNQYKTAYPCSAIDSRRGACKP